MKVAANKYKSQMLGKNAIIVPIIILDIIICSGDQYELYSVPCTTLHCKSNIMYFIIAWNPI